LVDKTPQEPGLDNLAQALARWLEAAEAFPVDQPRGLLALAEARQRLGLFRPLKRLGELRPPKA
jgi:hypothetical protein